MSYKRNVANQSVFFALVNLATGDPFPGAVITVKYTLGYNGVQQTGGGVITDLGNGQYRYVPLQAETDDMYFGFMFTAPGAIIVSCNVSAGDLFPAGAVDYTYTMTDDISSDPINNVDVWFCTDLAGTNIIWRGTTDIFGVARDVLGNKPQLDPGTYYIWRQLTGYDFDNPDTEIVS